MQFIVYAYDATDDKALERRMAVRPWKKLINESYIGGRI